jgi:hypothetical protein
MRVALVLLVAASISFAVPAAADDTRSTAPLEPTPTPSSSAGAAVAPTTGSGLTRVHGGLSADGAAGAGQQRAVALSVGAATPSAKVVRPAPTPRVLRRLGSERVVASLAPSIRACAADNESTAPLSFGMQVAVAPDGNVEGAEVASGARVAAPLVACVVKALSAAHFGSPGAAGASVVVPISVPGRAVVVATAVTSR